MIEWLTKARRLAALEKDLAQTRADLERALAALNDRLTAHAEASDSLVSTLENRFDRLGRQITDCVRDDEVSSLAKAISAADEQSRATQAGLSEMEDTLRRAFGPRDTESGETVIDHSTLRDSLDQYRIGEEGERITLMQSIARMEKALMQMHEEHDRRFGALLERVELRNHRKIAPQRQVG
jgi:hypothetical protein